MMAVRWYGRTGCGIERWNSCWSNDPSVNSVFWMYISTELYLSEDERSVFEPYWLRNGGAESLSSSGHSAGQRVKVLVGGVTGACSAPARAVWHSRLLHRPDRNAETLTTDGWIRTRDLARTDDRGYVTSSTGPAT